MTQLTDFTPESGWGVIYMYTLDNGKKYIGQTVNRLLERHWGHMSDSGNCIVDKALAKHDFTLEIIDYLPEEELDHAESYYIEYFNTLHRMDIISQLVVTVRNMFQRRHCVECLKLEKDPSILITASIFQKNTNRKFVNLTVERITIIGENTGGMSLKLKCGHLMFANVS